jgi:membrane-associated phospholipid phosphatase
MRSSAQSDKVCVIDMMVLAVGTGAVASVVGGRTLVYGIQRLPERRRRSAEWLLVVATAALAMVCGLSPERFGAEQRVLPFVLATVPGLLTYLACRSAAASVLVTILPLYFVIADAVRDGRLHAPATAFDRALPLQAGWIGVYGSHYVFVLLPLFVVRDGPYFRRVMSAYLMVFVVGYIGFLAYPTVAPHPTTVSGDGFAAWCLRLNYSLDSPYNCFPSLHVAVSVVAALACYRVHAGVGIAACIWAALIGLSTLYTKQHYAVDVVAGALLGYVAYVACLHSYARGTITENGRRAAPRRALSAAAVFAILVGLLWILYTTGLVVV